MNFRALPRSRKTLRDTFTCRFPGAERKCAGGLDLKKRADRLNRTMEARA
jgi:hypothetical protein